MQNKKYTKYPMDGLSPVLFFSTYYAKAHVSYVMVCFVD